jgi:hypothetical protein
MAWVPGREGSLRGVCKLGVRETPCVRKGMVESEEGKTGSTTHGLLVLLLCCEVR